MSVQSVALRHLVVLNPPTPKGLLASDEEVAIVPMASVSEQGSMEVREYRPANEVSSGLSYFADGDVLVAKITPCYENNKITRASVGRAHAFGSTEFHVLRPRDGAVDAGYLTHFLRQDTIRDQGTRRMTGSAGQRRVPRNFLEGLEIPLPSLDEQRRIAAILDQANALRRKRREALRFLKRLERATFIELFGDPLINDRNWPKKKIGAVGRVATGNTPPRNDLENYGDNIEWIKSDNLNNDSYFATKASERLSKKGAERARIAPEGSILVTCIAGSPDCIGNSSMIDRPVAFNQQINSITPSQIDGHFLYAQIRLFKKLIQKASTNSMKGMVNKSKFESIEVIDPPISLQERFRDHLEELRSMMELQSRQLKTLDALFASLQHRAFRGEL